MSSSTSVSSLLLTTNLRRFPFEFSFGHFLLSRRFLNIFGWIQMISAVLMAATFFILGLFCDELSVIAFEKWALFTIITILISVLVLGWQALEVADLGLSDAPHPCAHDEYCDCSHDQCRITNMTQVPMVYRGIAYWTLAITLSAFPLLLTALTWGPETSGGTKIAYALFVSVMTFSTAVFALFAVYMRVRWPFSTPNSLVARMVLWVESLKPKMQQHFNGSISAEVASENTPLIVS